MDALTDILGEIAWSHA